MAAAGTITVPAAYCGPPDSANGGISCGLLAAHLDAPTVEVTLRAPPPLDTPLAVDVTEGDATLAHGETVIATARPAGLDLPVLPPPPLDEVAAIHPAAEWFTDHPFPTCFTCGPARDDGLALYPRRLPETAVRFATQWRPGARFTKADGSVRTEVVWAALDCPSCFPFLTGDGRPPVVLGRLTAELLEPVEPEGDHIVISWPLGEDGRKRFGASAIFAGPRLVARAQATWIELRT